MVRKKSKILLILMIFVLTFSFCSPIVLADTDEAPGFEGNDGTGLGGDIPQIMEEGEQTKETLVKTGNPLAAVVDWGARNGLCFN